MHGKQTKDKNITIKTQTSKLSIYIVNINQVAVV